MPSISKRAFVIFAVLGPLLPSGCERAGVPGRDQAASDAVLARVQSEAPSEWFAFEAWVEKEIQAVRDPVPLPADPVLASSRWPCVRLETLVDQGQAKCDWQPRSVQRPAPADAGTIRHIVAH